MSEVGGETQTLKYFLGMIESKMDLRVGAGIDGNYPFFVTQKKC